MGLSANAIAPSAPGIAPAGPPNKVPAAPPPSAASPLPPNPRVSAAALLSPPSSPSTNSGSFSRSHWSNDFMPLYRIGLTNPRPASTILVGNFLSPKGAIAMSKKFKRHIHQEWVGQNKPLDSL